MKLPEAPPPNFYPAVAPRAGAWIETKLLSVKPTACLSPPARGRGLKPGVG